MAKRVQRLMRDLRDFEEISDATRIFVIDSDDFSSISVAVGGPPSSPFEEGTFQMKMRIPGNFPFSAPKVHFMTPIFHPNIGLASGAVCVDVLGEWKCGTRLVEVAEAIQALLDMPNSRSPLNADAALMLELNPGLYADTCRMWTAIHAGGPSRPAQLQETLEHYIEVMATTEERGLSRLTRTNWDLERAISVSRAM